MVRQSEGPGKDDPIAGFTVDLHVVEVTERSLEGHALVVIQGTVRKRVGADHRIGMGDCLDLLKEVERHHVFGDVFTGESVQQDNVVLHPLLCSAFNEHAAVTDISAQPFIVSWPRKVLPGQFDHLRIDLDHFDQRTRRHFADRLRHHTGAKTDHEDAGGFALHQHARHQRLRVVEHHAIRIVEDAALVMPERCFLRAELHAPHRAAILDVDVRVRTAAAVDDFGLGRQREQGGQRSQYPPFQHNSTLKHCIRLCIYNIAQVVTLTTGQN